MQNTLWLSVAGLACLADDGSVLGVVVGALVRWCVGALVRWCVGALGRVEAGGCGWGCGCVRTAVLVDGFGAVGSGGNRMRPGSDGGSLP